MDLLAGNRRIYTSGFRWFAPGVQLQWRAHETNEVKDGLRFQLLANVWRHRSQRCVAADKVRKNLCNSAVCVALTSSFKVPSSDAPGTGQSLKQTVPVYRKTSRPLTKSASPMTVKSPFAPANLPVPPFRWTG